MIQSYKISIRNGSISHAQLIDRFPSVSSQEINKLAIKFLKTSNYFVINQCIVKDIASEECISYLKEKDLSDNSQLKAECLSISTEYHSFRRLLPANYKDGLYQLNTHLPKPLEISELASSMGSIREDEDNNLAFIQWAQFIEQDLVKSVVSTMREYLLLFCCSLIS